MKTQQRNEISVDIKTHMDDCSVSVCEWGNGEGVDVSISGHHTTTVQAYTYGELEAILAITAYMRAGIKEDDDE